MSRSYNSKKLDTDFDNNARDAIFITSVIGMVALLGGLPCFFIVIKFLAELIK